MGLIYYPDTEPGIRRVRRGRGFSYLAPDGTRIDAKKERDRIAALAVPPAYSGVWISPHPNSHLLATGRDARERKQYRYHPDWRAERDRRKFDQLGRVGDGLPRMRRWIATRLSEGETDLDTAVAAVLALIDRASLRIGNPAYSEENGTYGAITLRSDHIRFEGDCVTLAYTAKGGKDVVKHLRGAQLQKVLQKTADLPGAELISWQNDAGQVQAVRSEHVQDRLAGIFGDGVTAKSLRTWNGSHSAFLVAMEPGDLTIAAMADAAAERLHNTPAISRDSYIHPDIVALSEMPNTERTRMLSRHDKDHDGGLYRKGEHALLSFLRG